MLHSRSLDFLIRIKNAYTAGHAQVRAPHSNYCQSIAQILKKYKLISDFSVEGKVKKNLVLDLNYTGNKPAIEKVKLFSKPGRRWYEKSSSLPWAKSPNALIIISTSQGLLSQKEAAKKAIGGEIIAEIN